MQIGEDHPAFQRLDPGETVMTQAAARDGLILVTDRRVAVATDGRLAMDLPIDGLRRIQFDIERTRPATLVIVPDHPGDEPQVLAIPPEQIDAVTTALAFIGKRLADAS
jgi:hypothetical protein